MRALDADADRLAADVEQAWGADLDDVLDAIAAPGGRQASGHGGALLDAQSHLCYRVP